MNKTKELIISNTLKDLGVKPSLLGYSYLRYAIGLAMDTPSIVHRTTLELYPRIAKQFDSTASRVERAIRHAIEEAWLNAKMDMQDVVFRSTVNAFKGKPTNTEFIATVADYLLTSEEVM